MTTLLLDAALLFLAASLHEDVAILMAAIFAHERGMPPAFGLTAVYAGAVTNNYAIYGLGKIARRFPGLQRWLINDKVGEVRERLKRHLLPTVVLCRFIPGSLSPAILGCGWLGVPFARFAVMTIISAALYISLISALVFTLGGAVLEHLGETAWLILGMLAIGVMGWCLHRRRHEAERRR